MIRRESAGQYHLITQDDHAKLSGELARQVGNDRFAELGDLAAAAVGMHDAGWPLHDQTPTLNSKGLPRDVFESNPAIALPVWTASADRAQAADPYAGLLVSLHVLALSAYATEHLRQNNQGFDLSRMQEKFAVNQFQHREVERQEQLRKQVGLRTDLPLTYGLATAGVDSGEDLLRFRFRHLQAMDLVSLAICCTQPPAATTREVHPRPGESPVHLSLMRKRADLLVVDPWPFRQERLTLDIPAKRLAQGVFDTEYAFRTAYAMAPVENLSLTIAVTA